MKASPATRVTPVKVLGTLAAVTLVGVLGVAGTTAALSDTTDSNANEFDAGEVTLADNDSGTFMYDVDNAEAGDAPVERCIQISYTGTRDSTVELYMDSTLDTLAPYVDLRVEAGTQTSPSFPNCTGFTAAATLYDGTLAGFRAAHGAAGGGAVFSPRGVGNPWQPDDTAVYRVTLELSTDTRLPGENFSGAHTYTWRADGA
ncbi:SipW-dependent-type signal peptide-containing protein [Blastococcus sp. CCUG 61487]|uniref:SipW-dependent-type signal peptide-containing protein n=1 Tax=Blastococcus sp. CCUG 61487 TaxID=1840703 RepID=UPI0010C0B9C8|nr:SipW-dependent-type signal peptide-containing protein [Blastococcus sp. CCUG 61487]TKJ20121.1 hypothetical protein A6V29_09280 [Blastococcus sp. CCUG 61487]